MRSVFKVFVCLIMLSLAVFYCCFGAFAKENNSNYTDIKICANMGECSEALLDKVKKCDADFISVDVKSVESTALISIIDALKENQILILDVKLTDVKNLYDYLRVNGKLENIKIRIKKCKPKNISALIQENKDFKDLLIPVYNGNIIFSAQKLISTATDENLNTVQFGTKNKNGVILYNSFTESFKKHSLSAIFSFVTDYNAKRNDDVNGWDNVISQGYSIIETDYPELLGEYLKTRNSYFEKLKALAADSEKLLDGTFDQESLNDLKEAYDNAIICLEHPSSLSEISTAYTNLSDSVNNIKPLESVVISNEFTFSFGRVIAVILCGGAFILSQVYLFKKRVK